MHNETANVTAPEVLIKQPGETRQFSMDFSSLLGSAETLSTSAVTASPSGLTLGVTSISGGTVLFSVAGGTHGVKYRIEVTVNTSASAVLIGDGILRIQDK